MVPSDSVDHVSVAYDLQRGGGGKEKKKKEKTTVQREHNRFVMTKVKCCRVATHCS